VSYSKLPNFLFAISKPVMLVAIFLPLGTWILVQHLHYIVRLSSQENSRFVSLYKAYAVPLFLLRISDCEHSSAESIRQSGTVHRKEVRASKNRFSVIPLQVCFWQHSEDVSTLCITHHPLSLCCPGHGAVKSNRHFKYCEEISQAN